jgi:hypothetical protein
MAENRSKNSRKGAKNNDRMFKIYYILPFAATIFEFAVLFFLFAPLRLRVSFIVFHLIQV